MHGSVGTGPATWGALQPLAERYDLVVPNRGGYPPNPPLERIDFEQQAEELAPLLADGAHLVGHSYGGVISLLIAARHPDSVRSLTVNEPPAFGVARGRPEIEKLVAGLDAFFQAGPHEPAAFLRGFLAAVGSDTKLPDPLPPELEHGARASMAERPPWEAEIPLDVLAASGLRVLVVRGDWCPAPDSARERAGAAFHAICDVIERRLTAETACFPASHGPQRLGKPFNDRLRAFWESH